MFKKPTKEELDEWMRTDFVDNPAAPVDQPPPTPSPSRLAHPPEVTQRTQEEPLATMANNGPAAAPIQLFTGDNVVAANEKHNNQSAMDEDDVVANVWDPESTITEDTASDNYLARRRACIAEKRDLIGTQVVVNSVGCETLSWVVREDITKNESPVDTDFRVNGLCAFNFSHTPKQFASTRKERIDFLELLIKLWPGDWEEQLQEVNRRIRAANDDERQSVRKTKKPKLMKEVSQHEFWVFWGLILAARACGKSEVTSGQGALWMALNQLLISVNTCQNAVMVS